jgi:LmbE family N-acetylglucosaminyl deacetylase
MADLETFPEDWDRALAVVAHPDDMEYGAAAAVARWTGQGKHVAYVLVSDGEAGISTMPPDEVGPLRRQEQLASCRVVGVDDVEFLGWPDGSIVEGAGAARRPRCGDPTAPARGGAVDQLPRRLGRAELEPCRPSGGRAVAARRRPRRREPVGVRRSG